MCGGAEGGTLKSSESPTATGPWEVGAVGTAVWLPLLQHDHPLQACVEDAPDGQSPGWEDPLQGKSWERAVGWRHRTALSSAGERTERLLSLSPA